MTSVRLRTVFLFLAAACHHDAPAAISDPKPAASVSAAPSASASAVASAASPPPAVPADIDAGPFHENTSQFAGAKLEPLRIELLPHDQRKRDDKKPGFVRIARVDGKPSGLATFGLATCDDSGGGYCYEQWYARPSSAHPLARPSAPATSWAEYRARFAPDPKPWLLVLEDSARTPVAVRYVGNTDDLKEVQLFDDRPAFSFRTYNGVVGIDDTVQFHVAAFFDGEVREVLSVYLGPRDRSHCPDGVRIQDTGPPGSVKIAATGAQPVIHVREVAKECIEPGQGVQGCAGTERDYAWDATQKRFVPQGAGKKVTLRSTPTGC